MIGAPGWEIRTKEVSQPGAKRLAATYLLASLGHGVVQILLLYVVTARTHNEFELYDECAHPVVQDGILYVYIWIGQPQHAFPPADAWEGWNYSPISTALVEQLSTASPLATCNKLLRTCAVYKLHGSGPLIVIAHSLTHTQCIATSISSDLI